MHYTHNSDNKNRMPESLGLCLLDIQGNRGKRPLGEDEWAGFWKLEPGEKQNGGKREKKTLRGERWKEGEREGRKEGGGENEWKVRFLYIYEMGRRERGGRRERMKKSEKGWEGERERQTEGRWEWGRWARGRGEAREGGERERREVRESDRGEVRERGGHREARERGRWEWMKENKKGWGERAIKVGK